MIQKIVVLVGGVDAVGIISICLFFAVFIGALIWAFCLKKSIVSALESLPLQDSQIAPAKGADLHE